jgi:hypothetical protein
VVVKPSAKEIHDFHCKDGFAIGDFAAEIFDLLHETAMLDDVVAKLGIEDALHPLLFGGEVLHGIVGELIESAGELNATLSCAHGIVEIVGKCEEAAVLVVHFRHGDGKLLGPFDEGHGLSCKYGSGTEREWGSEKEEESGGLSSEVE